MDIFQATEMATCHFDDHNGRSLDELGLRILKVLEEGGEAANAWIGFRGQNPRKGKTHTIDDVADELADLVFSALVAIASISDVRRVMEKSTEKMISRFGPQLPAGNVP